MISAKHEKHMYLADVSPTWLGIMQSGQVRYATRQASDASDET